MTPALIADIVAPLDALLLKGDADPATRAIMTTALVLSAPPDPARLYAAFERASHAVPRMRHRVKRSWALPGRNEWAVDEEFDLAYHVRFVGAPGDGSLSATLAMASFGSTAPFDTARPLWDASLVEGLDDGRAVLILRAHHAIADGVRAIHMLANLLDLEPNPSANEAQSLAQVPDLQHSRFTDALTRGAAQSIATRQERVEWLTRAAVNLATRPAGAIAETTAYARSALRTFDSGHAKPSPLLQTRSRARRFESLDLSLETLQRVGKANSATVNDVFLAGLLGGFAKYQGTFGMPIRDVPLSLPMNVSGGDAPDSGNHFSAAVIPGPASVLDPEERIQQVHALVASRRAERGADAVVRMAPALHQIPSWLASAGMAAYSSRIDLQASNVVGPACPTYLAGIKVDRFYGFGPLPGIPVMVVLVSYNGSCSMGFTIDPAAVTDPGLLVSCVRDAFDELSSTDVVAGGQASISLGTQS
jgi:diacylglycerol O-acyltransferase